MCIFSGRVEHVGSTKIFARNNKGRQFLVYSMDVQAPEDVAMVLPLPVSDHSEDAVKFINLEKYPTFFKDLEKMFDHNRHSKGLLSFSRGIGSNDVLKVHEVGDFIASFVPSREDFYRLDKRFRLPDTAWNALPDYSNYAFAVFQLKASKDVKNIHPMALEFPSIHSGRIYFPTVHLHDGVVKNEERFDHDLYWQGGEVYITGPKRSVDAQRTTEKLSAEVDLEKAQGIVVDEPGFKFNIRGWFANKDTLVGTN